MHTLTILDALAYGYVDIDIEIGSRYVCIYVCMDAKIGGDKKKKKKKDNI